MKVHSHYSRRQMIVESLAVLVFAALAIVLMLRLIPEASYLGLGAAILIGLMLADIASGLVHWAADTWGSANWPIIGPSLIRSFREHHFDQKAITRHGFLETNGASCLVSTPVLASLLFFSSEIPFLSLCILSMTLWILMTNQIHKWAHADRVPAAVRFFQESGLVLSPGAHSRHHKGGHLQSYCITTGWMNQILDGVEFFRKAEMLITKVTGAKPRAEEIESQAELFKRIKRDLMKFFDEDFTVDREANFKRAVNS